MGLWGAAQAIAFGLGGFLGTVASDLARLILGTPVVAYAAVFICQAALFLVAARLAARVDDAAPASHQDGLHVSTRRNDYVAGVSQI
jgi:BCD family chlorophyll transporter-like MFS transporter